MITPRSLSALLLLAFTTTLVAEPIRQPNDLQPGDKYRLIFLTSTVRDATSTDMADYDAFVQATADASPTVSTWGINWRAIGSTPDVDARDHTDAHQVDDESVPTFRLDGTLFAANYDHLWSGEFNIDLSGLRLTELGELVPIDPINEPDGIVVWTGTAPGGTASSRRGGPLGSETVRTGQAGLRAFEWLDYGSTFSSELHHMYGISDVLVAVPEPSCAVVASTVVGLFMCRRRRFSTAK